LESISSEHYFRDIYDEYWEVLYQIANKKTNAHHDALDIVQDTFTYIWNNITILRQIETGKIRTYLITCLYYRIFSFFRAKGLRNKHLQFFQVQIEHDPTYDISYEAGGENEELTAINVAIMAELDKMPVRMKELFLKNHLHDKSIHELAHEYRISNKTVSNQISIAKKKLKEFARSYPTAELVPLIILFLTKE
jgi:RNA polymerase sigma-70 factor (ECF subfamily)